ncbi:hypothetical protein, partial [Pigmentiphaga sp.]|uniref:hypothetical protein n=1 Tax=Pigmentiphaga sp. TaxID=1977564 RepID=UPI0025E53FB2
IACVLKEITGKLDLPTDFLCEHLIHFASTSQVSFTQLSRLAPKTKRPHLSAVNLLKNGTAYFSSPRRRCAFRLALRHQRRSEIMKKFFSSVKSFSSLRSLPDSIKPPCPSGTANFLSR